MLKILFQISRGKKDSLVNWVEATSYISEEKNPTSYYVPK